MCAAQLFHTVEKISLKHFSPILNYSKYIWIRNLINSSFMLVNVPKAQNDVE